MHARTPARSLFHDYLTRTCHRRIFRRLRTNGDYNTGGIMKFRNLISTAAIALLPLAASAATIVIPAAGTGPGASGSQWQSELTIHNVAARTATVAVTYHQGKSVLGPVSVTLQARQTVSIADVVKTKFGVDAG